MKIKIEAESDDPELTPAVIARELREIADAISYAGQTQGAVRSWSGQAIGTWELITNADVGMPAGGDNTAIHRIAHVSAKCYRTVCGRLVPRQPQTVEGELPRCGECWVDEG